jgi:hypothetical protein
LAGQTSIPDCQLLASELLRDWENFVHTGAMAANLPHRHHYIPCFYTSRWTGQDGQLCVFQQNSHKGVVHRRLAPKATGYQDRLYELRHALPKAAQKIEEELFRPVDTQASRALAAFEAGADPQDIGRKLLEGWARFMLSLLLRCPEDLRYLQDNWHAYIAKISPDMEEDYARDREAGDSTTLAQLVEVATPAYIEDTSMFALRFLISGEKSVPNILAAHWAIFNTSKSRFSLLTSDRPIVRLSGLDPKNLQMAMPIGPHLLFATFDRLRQWRPLSRQDADRLVMECNRKVVEGAAKYVYGLDSTQKNFVSANFGKEPAIRLMQHGMSRRLEGATG